MFNTKNYQEPVREEIVKIKANSINEVQIASIEYFESSQKKTPALRINLMAIGQDLLKVPNYYQMNLWLSPGAMNITEGTLVNIANATGTRTKLDSMSSELNGEETAKQLNDFLKDTKFRQSFKGREYLKDGEIRVAAEHTNVIESLTVNPSKLKPNANITRLEVTPSVESNNDSLPF